MFDVNSFSSSTTLNKSNIDPSLRPMSQTPITEKRRNYRFYAGDPAIHPAEKRLYANGAFEGTPLHVSGFADPRDITRPDRSVLDLPVPRFKIDRCWIGAIPAKEVTFRNLNDNITKIFLTDTCKRFGEIDDCKIYYDRQTKKHLGLGTVIFKTTKAARECVAALHMSTKMGSVVSVSLETSTQERTKQYATLIRAQEQEKAAQEKALAASAAASPPPPPSNDHGNKQSTDRSQTSISGSSKNKKYTSSNSNSDYYRSAKSSSRTDSRTRHQSSNDTTDQYSYDQHGTIGTNSNSHRTHHRSRHNNHSRSSHNRHRASSSSRSHSRRQRRRSRSSSRSVSSTSRSSSSSSSRSSKSSTSSSTSRSYSSSSSSSRSSSSRSPTPNHKRSNDSRMNRSKQQQHRQYDEDHRPSLDERIAALFQQQNPTNPLSSQSSKTHHRSTPLSNLPPPSAYPYPPPPHLPTSLANVVGSHHHHHQQSYGVVNNFNFFGNSFPPASFLNSAGGTNWEDMFKQPPPLSASTTMTTTTTTTINYPSIPISNGLQPQPTDSFDERERKTNDLTTAVSNIVTGELVEILRKDLAKKLVETLVYKSIESWFDNEERKDKIRKFKSAEQSSTEPPAQTGHQDSNVQLQHSISNPSIERVPEEVPATPLTAPVLSSSTSNTTLTTYFEQLKDSTGLPIRTQMPKIPSFKKRTVPEEKPNVTVDKTKTPIQKKEKVKSQPTRPTPRKRLRSSTSPSSISSDTEDDSRSRDVEPPATSEMKTPVKSILKETPPPPPPPVPEAPVEEEEGEIKDEDEDEDEMIKEDERKPALPSEVEAQPKTPPPPLPPQTSEQLLSPTVKKKTKKTPKEPKEPKEPKKPASSKKRKVDSNKPESKAQTDNIENHTPVKRKKSASTLPSMTPEKEEFKPIQTFNLLDSLPEQTIPIIPMASTYNRFSYISIEHNYAIMAKQPVPIAKRLTMDGLNDLGIQIPSGPPPPVPKFPPREHDAEMRIMYDIDQGIDEEDMNYLKQSFQALSDQGHSCTLKTRWVDHPATRDSSFVKPIVAPHRTGCARTEGYYKVIKEEKVSPIKTTDPSQSTAVLPQAMLDTSRTTGAQMSRELRSENRRNLVALGDAEFADHFKFSHLKLRKKRLRYAKSSIHSWGLFACEPIAMEDMVIEYVGETIRQSVGDLREKKYELEGINSNYMFRIDSDTIVDATKCGNLARFINHSCDPNCYAKIIPVESQKKIVIYSRRDIRLGEEITYDYKFPLEEQKIPCRCGTPVCRGSLN